jgi:transposase
MVKFGEVKQLIRENRGFRYPIVPDQPMKFNLTRLEISVFFLVCLVIYIWTKHGRRIHYWLQGFFRQRQGPRNLKPKSPEECPLCNQHFCFLPYRPKLEVVPWSERKSRRGRPKTVDTGGHACLDPLCDYFAIADPEIHALVSNGCRGKQRILYLKCQACGGCHTSRFGTPLYWLKTPLARIAMVMTAMSEGVDILAAGRIFGHHHTTITRWVERCGRHSERLHQRLFHRARSIGHLQLDELVTKVKQDAERLWVWTAVAAQSKLILALHIGRRSSAEAHHLLHQVWQRLSPQSLPIFTSDGLNPYFYGITAHFGF